VVLRVLLEMSKGAIQMLEDGIFAHSIWWLEPLYWKGLKDNHRAKFSENFCHNPIANVCVLVHCLRYHSWRNSHSLADVCLGRCRSCGDHLSQNLHTSGTKMSVSTLVVRETVSWDA
jgi:hypothetical protein